MSILPGLTRSPRPHACVGNPIWGTGTLILSGSSITGKRQENVKSSVKNGTSLPIRPQCCHGKRVREAMGCMKDSAGKLVSQAQMGMTFTLKASTDLEFPSRVMKKLLARKRRTCVGTRFSASATVACRRGAEGWSKVECRFIEHVHAAVALSTRQPALCSACLSAYSEFLHPAMVVFDLEQAHMVR